MYGNRSIYLKLKNFSDGNIIWNKYIKLLANDYYESYNKIKEVSEKKSIFEFWTSQIRAIDDGLLSKDESFVVQMPTSAGKTFIAELFILKYLINYKKKVLYISPFRALASEKVSELGKYFSYLGYKVSSSTGSYEYDPLFESTFDDADVLILTPEKADSILRLYPEIFTNIGGIVVDEGHIVGELNSRAALTELLLIKLKNKYREIKTLFISAVMPPLNASEYAQWLSNKKENVLRSKLFIDSDIKEEWEPTRKNLGFFKWFENQDGTFNGQIRFLNVKTENEKDRREINAYVPYFLKDIEYGIKTSKAKPETAALLGIKVSEIGNTLIFCGQVQRIESVAEKYLKIFEKNPQGIDHLIPDENKESYFYSKVWYGENNLITKSILYGIGIHYGDMPEQVRAAVEKDYKCQKLKILLCTNTVGQGVNFPIKNIIFYDVTTGYNEITRKQKLISNRDFWNIIGRSGRAEKETEGNIIFIINTPSDWKHFTQLINKDNIEMSKSYLSYALSLRLSDTIFDSIILELLETFLLDMLTEEVFENDEMFINNLIDNGLFKIQSTDEDIKKIHSSFHKAICHLKEIDNNLLELQEFGKNGLDYNDNQIILNFINVNKEIINSILCNKDVEQFIDLFLKLITENDLNVLNGDKITSLILDYTWEKYKNIIMLWIQNGTVSEIQVLWNLEIQTDFKGFYLLLARGLFYFFPWICNALILLIAFVFEKEYFDIPEEIRLIPTFLKYGLNNKIACTARQCGIKNRETSLVLAKQSKKITDKDFITWLANLSKQDIDLMDISPFEKDNVLDVSFNLITKNNTNGQENFTVSIVGTKYDEQWKKNSKHVSIGDKLTLIRDKDNKYDPFAILVAYNERILGYIPRENAKYMATEMDLNNTKYEAIVLSTSYVQNEDYNIINISVNVSFF